MLKPKTIFDNSIIIFKIIYLKYLDIIQYLKEFYKNVIILKNFATITRNQLKST